jgi:hypothetical protein
MEHWLCNILNNIHLATYYKWYHGVIWALIVVAVKSMTYMKFIPVGRGWRKL